MDLFWYHVAVDFQQAIVGALGFLGIIGTLFGNALVARRQRRREAFELSRSLMVELDQARRSIQSIAKYKDTQAADRMILPMFRTPIFDANVQHIGRLPGRAAPIVARAYHQVQILWDGVRYAADSEKSVNVFSVPISKVPAVQEKAAHVVKRLDEAIDALAKELGEPRPSS